MKTNEYRYEKTLKEIKERLNRPFEISEGKEEIIIKNFNLRINVYSENYTNPPIPDGYKKICGNWNEGLVIERSSDGSQFVWIPVGSLSPNGTLDGKYFFEKFGRRKYRLGIASEGGDFSQGYSEALKHLKTVKKYGGFYVSRYAISKSLDGKLHSRKDLIPIQTDIFTALQLASNIERYNEEVSSHLICGAEYDTMVAWFIRTRSKTIKVLGIEDNYEYQTNNVISTFSREWTQEKCDKKYIVRADFCGISRYNEAFYSNRRSEDEYTMNCFRVVLDIK